MNSYSIIMDAACDLSLEMTERWDIKVLPMSVTIGEETFEHHPDGRGMSCHEFYERLRKGETASTAAVSLLAWKEVFEEELKKGRNVLAMPFSRGLSSTYNNACIAAGELIEEYPEKSICVADTGTATIGGAVFAKAAFENRENGMSLKDNRRAINNLAMRVCHYFTVEDLGHLHRGGRISAATAIVGGALGIKPVLHVDDEGKLVDVGKVRGRKKSLRALADYMSELSENPETQEVFVSHGDCEAEAIGFAKDIKERFGCMDVMVEAIGPVIGAHAGPGTIALIFQGIRR